MWTPTRSAHRHALPSSRGIRLPRFRPFLDYVLSRQHTGAEFPPVLVGVEGFLIAQFEHVSALLAEVDGYIHHGCKLFDTLDPVVFNCVRQAAASMTPALPWTQTRSWIPRKSPPSHWSAGHGVLGSISDATLPIQRRRQHDIGSEHCREGKPKGRRGTCRRTAIARAVDPAQPVFRTRGRD